MYPLRVKRAPEPRGIMWENFQTVKGKVNAYGRRLFTLVITALVGAVNNITNAAGFAHSHIMLSPC